MGGGIVNELNYSTTEQVVGTWIDGKPLYQIVITGISFSSKQNLVTFASTNKIRSISGCVYSSTTRIPVGYGTGSEIVFVYQDSSGIQFQNGYYSTCKNGELIIRYTKTTD